MVFEAPKVVISEHRELREMLNWVKMEPYPLGEVAESAIKVLEPHVQKEEGFALPPLALLPQLAKGEFKPEMSQALDMAKKLSEGYDDMLIDHRLISAALEKLRVGAINRNRSGIVEVVEKFFTHIKMEEQIFYPATLLIGEYIKQNANQLSFAQSTT